MTDISLQVQTLPENPGYINFLIIQILLYM